MHREKLQNCLLQIVFLAQLNPVSTDACLIADNANYNLVHAPSKKYRKTLGFHLNCDE
eukprot:m.5875 g.5875  ORF g.5875 m.5875 type:complete len:58 (+) comp14342_c0_seq1:310-483(+)